MRCSLVVAAAALTLTGCVRDLSTELRERHAHLRGKPVSAFMAEKVATPTGSFDAGGKRVFAFRFVSPDRVYPCDVHVVTHVRAKTGPATADGWLIDDIIVRGGCDLM